jgi:hypothetical protein
MLFTLLTLGLLRKGKEMGLFQIRPYGATVKVQAPRVGAVDASSVLPIATMAAGLGVFGAVLWGFKGAALGALLGSALGYVASHPDSVVPADISAPAGSGSWTDDAHYKDIRGNVWTAQMVGGAWTASSPAYSDKVSAAAMERETMGPKIDALVVSASSLASK